MTVEKILEVLALGDKYGSALKDMLRWLKVCDLLNVTDGQADMYIAYKKRGEAVGTENTPTD